MGCGYLGGGATIRKKRTVPMNERSLDQALGRVLGSHRVCESLNPEESEGHTCKKDVPSTDPCSTSERKELFWNKNFIHFLTQGF